METTEQELAKEAARAQQAALERRKAEAKDPLHCIRWDVKFPGRTKITPGEAAEALSISRDHVIDLIEERLLGAETVSGGEKVTRSRRYFITRKGWEQFMELRRNRKGRSK